MNDKNEALADGLEIMAKSIRRYGGTFNYTIDANTPRHEINTIEITMEAHADGPALEKTLQLIHSTSDNRETPVYE